MITRCTEWMSGRWWAALAVLLAFILVARTGTVGSPAEAHVSPFAPRTQAATVVDATQGEVPGDRLPSDVASSEPLNELQPGAQNGAQDDDSAERIRQLENELALALQTVRFERDRAELLRINHDHLDSQLARLGARVRATLEADDDPIAGTAVPAQVGSETPRPIEALFVRER